EYSQKRGPTMADDLRSIDRSRNIHRYPDINYDVIYVLESGYRNFFNTYSEMHSELFCPQRGYVEMKQESKQLGKFNVHKKRHDIRRVRNVAAREKIREKMQPRLGWAQTRLHFKSDDDSSPEKKRRRGLKEKDVNEGLSSLPVNSPMRH
ncbi:hypothetical protein PENTCL1PPCAC_1712, partial [Pristionchus entomophagus]